MPVVDSTKLGFKGAVLFSGFFKTVLQQHFSSIDSLFDPALSGLLWRPTDKATGQTNTQIYIDNKLKANPNQANFRPAILIHRNDWAKKRFALGDAADTSGSMYGAKVALWEGSHSFDCLAQYYTAAESLAQEVATFFTVYSEHFSNALCCNWMLVTSLSAPVMIPEETKDTVSITVSVEYSVVNHWMLQPDRPKLRHIFLRSGNQSDFDQFVENTLKQ